MDYKKNILRVAKSITVFVLSGFVRCLPMKRNRIILSSIPDFSDNAWALYKYIKENRKDLDPYWIVSKNKINLPPEVDSKIVLRLSLKNSLSSYWIILRAKYIFSTHGFNTNGLNRKRQLNVYLNHGSCPIKGAKGKGVVHPNKNLIVNKSYDYILCRGKDAVDLQAKFSCCEKSKVLPLGMARDDIFIKNIGDGDKNPFYNGNSEKLILWMPTFRRSKDAVLSENNSATNTGLPLMENEKDLLYLDEFLKKKNIQLLIKIHPLQKENDIFRKAFSNITIITDEDLKEINKQLYEIIGFTDALITDYSSVYFDYLLTDKPVGFILDDYDKYLKDRGFVMEDPKQLMAGHHIYNINQFEQFLIDVINEKDEYVRQRHNIKQKYVGLIPESTCKAILDFFNV